MRFDEGMDVFGVFENGFESEGKFLDDEVVLFSIPEGDEIVVYFFGQGSGLISKVPINIFFNSFFRLYAQKVFLSPGYKFFSGECDLINIELVPVKEFRQDVEVLDFVLFEVFEFLVVGLAGVGVVEAGDGVAEFGVGDWVVGQMGGREDAGHVEDLLVDDLVADMAGDCFVGTEPVLDFIDADVFAGFESVAVFGLEVVIDQLYQKVFADISQRHNLAGVGFELPDHN
jgi:hypothetical protein